MTVRYLVRMVFSLAVILSLVSLVAAPVLCLRLSEALLFGLVAMLVFGKKV